MALSFLWQMFGPGTHPVVLQPNATKKGSDPSCPKVAKRVRTFLEGNNVSFTEEDGFLAFRLAGLSCSCLQLHKVIQFRASRVAVVDPGKVGGLCQFLNATHRNALLGRWSVDEDGDVDFVVSLYKEKGGPSPAATERCLTVLVQSVLAVQPQLRQFLTADSPDRSCETFGYLAGASDPTVQWFDISEEACSKFGFSHGDRVRDTATNRCATVIGVRKNDSGELDLWFHSDGIPGAAVLDEASLGRLRKVGCQAVEPAG